MIFCQGWNTIQNWWKNWISQRPITSFFLKIRSSDGWPYVVFFFQHSKCVQHMSLINVPFISYDCCLNPSKTRHPNISQFVSLLNSLLFGRTSHACSLTGSWAKNSSRIYTSSRWAKYPHRRSWHKPGSRSLFSPSFMVSNRGVWASVTGGLTAPPEVVEGYLLSTGCWWFHQIVDWFISP